MGIIYQCAVRFIKVKDLSKVDLTIAAKTLDGKNDLAFEDYLIKAKENLLVKLKEVIFDPCAKRNYLIERIKVPEGTEVIAFGNEACDRYGGCYYEIVFHYENPDDDYVETCFADVERNRFMYIPKTCSSRLVSIDYQVGVDPCNTYDEKYGQVSFLSEDGVWTRLPSRYEEGYMSSDKDENEDENIKPLQDGIYCISTTMHNRIGDL